MLHVESFKIADKARGVDPADKEEQEKLTAELRRLEEQSEKADGETAILEAAVQEHWNAFASFKCRELMRRVELLPRELRIMVFEALWENSYHMISEWNLQPLKTKCDGPIELLESWSSRGMQHCLKERFMGPNMLSEITEAWWRTSIFEIKALHLVPYFLSEAFWGGSVKDRVRHVVIPFKYRRRPSPGHSPAQITGGAKCECLNNELDHLMHFSTCTQIEFRYKVAEIREPRFTVGWRQDEFLRAVSRIYPGLEKLKQKGYLMVAVIDGDITISMKDTEIASEAWRQTINDQVGVG